MKQSPRIDAATHKAYTLGGTQFAADAKKHAENHERALARLAKAVASKSQSAVHSAVHHTCTAYSSRIVCTLRGQKPGDYFTAQKVSEVAKSLNVYKDCGEPIWVRAEPKTSGNGWRPICQFGPIRRALHELCFDMLTVMFGNSECNYLRKGLGADRAADRLSELIDNGYDYFVVADIKDY